jgi:hypothetical protein
MSKTEPKPFALNGTNNPVVHNWLESGRDIYLDEFYFIGYADQKRVLRSHGIKCSDKVIILDPKEAAEEQQEILKQLTEKFPKYFNIYSWIGMEQYKARCIAELAPEENPNYIRITGRMLVTWANEGFIPQFDDYFEKTRRLLMVPVQAYDHYHESSYMLRNEGWYKNKERK